MIEALKKVRQHLLTGVSYVIPLIACGGILIAVAIALVPMGDGGPDFAGAPLAKLLLDVGAAAFELFPAVLGGYIAYALAGKPGLVPGFVGGHLAGQVKAGFLGALVIGLAAGWIANALKRLPLPRPLRPILPILVVPVLSSLLVGVLMLRVIGAPIAGAMTGLEGWLRTLSDGNAAVLAAVLGGMIAFDMGGPVNKAAFFFGAAMIQEGNYAVMGACAAAICTPPLGLGLATVLRRGLWRAEEREAGLAALAMGMIGITEGAIPFAASDPLRVIPCIVGGSMLAAVIAMLGGVGDHAPHGGPIVLPVVDRPLAYVLAIVAGALVTALAINGWKALARARAGAEANA